MSPRPPATVLVHLATTNQHKAREIQALLAPFGIEVVVPKQLPAVEENGTTFRENALLKARAAARALGVSVLAEDSGLVVEALGGEPGVRSARYAGEGASAAENNARLVERLVALGVEDPRAAFVCHAVYVSASGEVLAEAEGRVEGVIGWPARGTGGFGYDPMFHHPASGRRLSELAPAEKNALSHRGQALRALAGPLRAHADATGAARSAGGRAHS